MIALTAMFIIVNDGMASAVSRYARDIGVQGATVVRAQGSLPSRILCFLGLERVAKEIVLFVLPESQHDSVFESICKKFCFEKTKCGIAFTVPADYYLGIKRLPGQEPHMQEKELNQNPHLIITIVDRGNAPLVIDAANEAGARGATILHGRGSGIEKTEAFFKLNIQPEKDLILIVAPSQHVAAICQNIGTKAHLHEDGRGILFTLPINDTAGILALQP